VSIAPLGKDQRSLQSSLLTNKRNNLMKNNTQDTVKSGIDFLAHEQQIDGSFMCMTTTIYDEYQNGILVPAIVPSSIVLSSMIHLPETESIASIKQKTATFLLFERSNYWSFNYWFRASREYTEVPYPDDLDDTFCALAALYEYDKALFDGEAMGRIVTMLTLVETEEGGPYNMWLVQTKPDSEWRDIDLVVNSNIAFFLSLCDIHLLKLNHFIEKSILENKYEFPYNSIYPAIYFISRFYKGTQVDQMIDLLLSNMEPNGAWENPLRTALAVSALINFSDGTLDKKIEALLKKSIAYITNTQLPDGSWSAYSFFFQINLKDKKLYAGSASITTALCLETINKFEMITEKVTPQNIAPLQKNEGKNIIYNTVHAKAVMRFLELAPDLKKQGLSILQKITELDKDKQIVLLADSFRTSLEENTQKIEDDFVTELGLANLYGWIAYAIYDDFIDGEGKPHMLPVANLCLRESCTIFKTILPEKTGFANLSSKIFDKIDMANSFEMAHCRTPYTKLPIYTNYSQLANRSLGHALGPIALLFKLGYTENSKEVTYLTEFFKHYLIARQLNDDAHDWKEDFARGQLSPVVVHIIRVCDTDKEMESVFWNKIIMIVCGDILREITQAKKSIQKLKIISNNEYFFNLLKPIETSARTALAQHKNIKSFLQIYNQ
jgi:hypothetical protein